MDASPELAENYAKSFISEQGTIYRRGEEFCIDVIVSNANGLHLRPSAALAEVITRYERTRVVLEAGNTTLEIKGQMNIIGCRVKHKTKITFRAAGPDTTAVLNELYRTILIINHRDYDAPENQKEEY